MGSVAEAAVIGKYSRMRHKNRETGF